MNILLVYDIIASMKIRKLTLMAMIALWTPVLLAAEAETEELAIRGIPLILLQAAAIVFATRVGHLLGGKRKTTQIIGELTVGLVVGLLVLHKDSGLFPFRMIAIGVVVTAVAVVLTALLAAKGFEKIPPAKNEETEGEGSNHLKNFVMVPHLEAESSDDAIAKLVHILKEKGKIENEAAVLDSIRQREKSMPTGLDHGLAVPHGRTNAVKSLVGAVAMVDDPNGIPNYETIDKSPVRIVVLSVSSESQAVDHLHLLSEISKSLRDDESRQNLLSCRDAEEMLDFISRA